MEELSTTGRSEVGNHGRTITFRAISSPWVDKRRRYVVMLGIDSLEELSQYLEYRCQRDGLDLSLGVARSLWFVEREPRVQRM